jgi:uncharacterized protein YuzE
MKKYSFNIRVSTDEKTGKLLAAYIRIRAGKAVETVEVEEDRAYADYDARGHLIGIELLAPCRVQVLDHLVREEPKEVREFLHASPPASMVLV